MNGTGSADSTVNFTLPQWHEPFRCIALSCKPLPTIPLDAKRSHLYLHGGLPAIAGFGIDFAGSKAGSYGMRRMIDSTPPDASRSLAPTGVLRTWARALRLHQWAKNLLVFVPLLASHRLYDTSAVLAAMFAFLAFGFCASGNYLLNDIVDRTTDLHHPRKRFRPVASGQVSLTEAGIVSAALLCMAFGLAALTLPPAFSGALALYLGLALCYSLALKRVALLDTLCLGGLYTIRVIAGGLATHVVPSFWLLAFSMFLFLSIAIAKRHAELQLVLGSGAKGAPGRGYSIEDMPLLACCGIVSGYLSALVLAFYVNSGAIMYYSRPRLLWPLCVLLLYWISRVWLETTRGRMHDDPVNFALTDRPSLLVAALGFALIWLAI
jgi:4-hydroxybenzoate polyprenyltransferase